MTRRARRPLVMTFLGLALAASAPPPPVPPRRDPAIPEMPSGMEAWPVIRRGDPFAASPVPTTALQGPATDVMIDLHSRVFSGGSAEVNQHIAAALDWIAAVAPPGEPIDLTVWTTRSPSGHVREEALLKLGNMRAASLREALEARNLRPGTISVIVRPRHSPPTVRERGVLVTIPLGDLPRAR